MIRGSRRHSGAWAALAHRLSGLLLVVFIPAHFLVLGLAIESEAALENAIRWMDQPLVKAAEWGLLVVVTLHLVLGVRVLALEFLPWRGFRKMLIGFAGAAALLVGFAFLLNR